MPALTGSNQPIDLAPGYSLRAPGIVGNAELRTAVGSGRGRSIEDGTMALSDALAATGVTEVRQIVLQLAPAPGAGPAAALRSVSGQAVVEVAVPDFGPDTGQLILACDESGVLTWHLPLDDQQSMQTTAMRGSGGQKRFLIPAAAPPPSVLTGDGAKRSIIGTLGRKLLKVLIYPVLDPLVGAVSDSFAEKWESQRRPYGLRSFTPENFRTPVAETWSPDDWARIGAKRALLFLHGTFSTAQDAFCLLSDDTFAELHRRYEGRVFAFNHFTLSHSPEDNARWFLAALPQDRALTLDIVCHSRGGLVARTLTERPSAFGLDTARVAVGRIVFAGVPNAGTLLAHPDHVIKLLDRVTTALNLFPTGIVTEMLESILTTVKVIGHGAIKGLTGLACMKPDGEYLSTLNQGAPTGAEYYAIAASYVPSEAGMKLLLAGTLADAVVDRVFDHVENDLVVPEPGVYAENGCPTFPITDPRRKLMLPPNDGIIHTTIFRSPRVQSQLLEWLT